MKQTKKRAITALTVIASELESSESTALTRMLGKLGELRKLVESAILSEAVEQHGGNLVHACKALGIPHRTAARWVAARPELAREVERARRKAA